MNGKNLKNDFVCTQLEIHVNREHWRQVSNSREEKTFLDLSESAKITDDNRGEYEAR